MYICVCVCVCDEHIDIYVPEIFGIKSIIYVAKLNIILPFVSFANKSEIFKENDIDFFRW